MPMWLYVFFIIGMGVLLLYAGKVAYKKQKRAFSFVLFIIGGGIVVYGVVSFFLYFIHWL